MLMTSFLLFSPSEKKSRWLLDIFLEAYSRRFPTTVLGWAERGSPGPVNYVLAVAYHFYTLHKKYSQPGDHFLGQPCANSPRGGRRRRLRRRRSRRRRSCPSTSAAPCRRTRSSSPLSAMQIEKQKVSHNSIPPRR